jgi:hypothetical protein
MEDRSETSSTSSNKELEAVERFVTLLGSSAGRQISDENGGELTQCISSSVEEDDIVCSLPTFKVKEENRELKPLNALRSFQKSLGNGVRSMLKLEESDKDDSSVIFTKESIETAPLTLLRSLQDAFQFYSKSRFQEWKEILQKHPSQEAGKLVNLMKYHKMIVGCRGNTSLHINGPWEQHFCSEQKEEDESLDTCSVASESTDEEKNVLACNLRVEFFIKIRNGPRTFATSSYTLSFEVPGVVWCKYVPRREYYETSNV